MASAPHWLIGFVIVVAGVARAEIPDAARQDPRFALGYVVVTHYPGVRADGTGDSTAGLQAAIVDAYENHLAVLVPAGTYQISDTLKCYEWNFWDTRRNRARNPDRRNHVLIGSKAGEARPLLRLRSGAAGFGDPDKPRPMLAYRVFTADTPEATEPIEPADPLLGNPPNFHDQPNILFDSELRGIDFDCGGNRGAIGVAFRAAQDSSIENVRVTATGASAGIRGIPGRNGGAANLEVVGGDFGLDLVDGGLAGTIAVGVKLVDQTERAVRQHDFCPLMMVGFEIVKDAGPVVSLQHIYENTASGTLCAIDGSITLRRGGVAVDNAQGKTVYLRNVFVSGTTELVKSGEQPAVTGAGPWSRIAEYVYADQRSPEGRPPYQPNDKLLRVFSLLDGVVSRAAEPVVATSNEAPPPDLISRHQWTELPSFEGQDDGTCVVTRAPYNAAPNDDGDDRAALQAAIDAAAAAGHGRVFLPAGSYQIGGTLTLRANTRLFGVGRLVTIIQWHDSWRPTTGEPTMIETVDDPEARTTLASLTITTRTAGGGINARGAHDWDRFNHLHWRAGRHSQIIAVSLAKEWVAELFANPHDNLKLTGSGGGRFYFVAPSGRWFGRHPDCRALRVSGTTQPLSIYGLNLEFVARDPKATPTTNVELSNAANVRIYSIKREMSPPTLILRDCHNIGIFGHGRQVSAPYHGSGGMLQVLGASDGVTIGPVLFDMTSDGENGEATIREDVAGRRAEIAYPDCVSIYKRGALDDEAMRR